MKKTAVFLFWYLFFLLQHSSAQRIPMIHANQLTNWKASVSDTIYVINFWATWCKPCVEEIPVFVKLFKNYSDPKIKIILVSNDFKKHIQTHLVPFVKANHIASQVVFMDEPNPNDWIELVDPNWSGAIPATLFIKGNIGFSEFHEGILSYNDLLAILNKIK